MVTNTVSLVKWTNCETLGWNVENPEINLTTWSGRLAYICTYAYTQTHMCTYTTTGHLALCIMHHGIRPQYQFCIDCSSGKNILEIISTKFNLSLKLAVQNLSPSSGSGSNYTNTINRLWPPTPPSPKKINFTFCLNS